MVGLHGWKSNSKTREWNELIRSKWLRCWDSSGLNSDMKYIYHQELSCFGSANGLRTSGRHGQPQKRLTQYVARAGTGLRELDRID